MTATPSDFIPEEIISLFDGSGERMINRLSRLAAVFVLASPLVHPFGPVKAAALFIRPKLPMASRGDNDPPSSSRCWSALARTAIPNGPNGRFTATSRWCPGPSRKMLPRPASTWTSRVGTSIPWNKNSICWRASESRFETVKCHCRGMSCCIRKPASRNRKSRPSTNGPKLNGAPCEGELTKSGINRAA